MPNNIKNRATSDSACCPVLLFIGFSLFYGFLQIILHRFLRDFNARHIGSSADHVSGNRGSHEKKSDCND